MARIRPKYTAGMNDVRRLVDTIGKSNLEPERKDWVLWVLLTALRGPDNGNGVLKDCSTARLRAAFFPALAQAARANRSPGELHKINPGGRDTQYHFAHHFNAMIDGLEELKKAL